MWLAKPSARPASIAPAPIVEARNLCKSHIMAGKPVQVLDSANFTIQPGAFVAIVGPSGSGKSTLLSLLATLDTPTSGELLIDGMPTRNLGANRLAALRNASIGFVFQHFHLLPRTAAIDQVLLPARYARGGLTKHIKREAERRLCQVGLGKYLLHKPNQLSGGQQQRVAIARALINSPRLILADEPTGALDRQSGRDILELLRELNESGITIVMVTHDRTVANTARRIIRMQDGCVTYDGPSFGPSALLKATA